MTISIIKEAHLLCDLCELKPENTVDIWLTTPNGYTTSITLCKPCTEALTLRLLELKLTGD